MGRPDLPVDSKGVGQGGRPPPICFRCGKTGHISANCTNAPNAKRKKATDSADVIFDVSSWANDFAEWRRAQAELASAATASGLECDTDASADSAAEADAAKTASGLASDVDAHAYARADDAEDVNGLEETNGFAILDSGATVMCSSTIAAFEPRGTRTTDRVEL